MEKTDIKICLNIKRELPRYILLTGSLRRLFPIWPVMITEIHNNYNLAVLTYMLSESAGKVKSKVFPSVPG